MNIISNKPNHIAVAIPCYNEIATISKVVKDFQSELPDATVYVFDNNSTDGSSELAEDSGALVITVHSQGKGHVMRAIFNTVTADYVIVADGDDTYFVEDAAKLLAPVLNNEADMAVGNRLPNATDQSLRRLHHVGNRLIVFMINQMFRTAYKDILSGYRVFNRRFIQSVPLLTPGFETETELTLQALERDFRIIEIPISYRSRPEGSESKLRSFYDGYQIMMAATVLLRDHHPLRVFGGIGVTCLTIGVIAGLLWILMSMGIDSLPITLLAGIILLMLPIGFTFIGIGLFINTINTRFKEITQLIERRKDLD